MKLLCSFTGNELEAGPTIIHAVEGQISPPLIIELLKAIHRLSVQMLIHDLGTEMLGWSVPVFMQKYCAECFSITLFTH